MVTKLQCTPGSYITIRRRWQDGDQVEIKSIMTLRIESLPGEPKIVALFYGPIALAGELGTQGLERLNLCTYNQLDLAMYRRPTCRCCYVTRPRCSDTSSPWRAGR